MSDKYKLIRGDCIEALARMGTGSVDAIITDPPYLDGDLSNILDELMRVGKRVVITPGKLEAFNWIRRRKPVYEYAWINNTQSLGGSACLHMGWEPVLAYHFPLQPLGIDVLRYPIETNTGVNHPWPKPLALMSKLVRHWTRAGESVLDPFMGSGTTGVACVLTGRKFVGIEICPEYFQAAKERIDDAAGFGPQPPLPLVMPTMEALL